MLHKQFTDLSSDLHPSESPGRADTPERERGCRFECAHLVTQREVTGGCVVTGLEAGKMNDREDLLRKLLRELIKKLRGKCETLVCHDAGED